MKIRADRDAIRYMLPVHPILNDGETIGIFFNNVHDVNSRLPRSYDFKKPITSEFNPELCASSQDSLNKICSACPDSELK